MRTGRLSQTFRAAALTGFVELARSIGLDPLRMLDEAGIPRAALTDPDMRISTAAGSLLIEGAGRVAEDFALRLSETRTPSVMGPVALVAREQPTVRGVVEAIVRHIRLHTDGIVYRLEDAGDVAIVYISVRDPSGGPVRQVVELATAQLTRFFRLYLGSGWRPLCVSFVHGPPKSMDTHRRVLGPNVDFNQPFNGVVCERADLERPNLAADPAMAREIERYVQGLGGASSAAPPDQVRELVQALLPTGCCTLPFVARQIGVDLRTLQRRLAEMGANFVDIVQTTRMGLVAQYLEAQDRPLSEVAELLGFSAESAFSRWHRTHFGTSPSHRRHLAQSAVQYLLLGSLAYGIT